MWRPKNWENPYAPDDYPSRVVSAFEAGADAMLEALKERGQETIVGMTMFTGSDELARRYDYGAKGWLVFIPDKEEK